MAAREARLTELRSVNNSDKIATPVVNGEHKRLPLGKWV